MAPYSNFTLLVLLVAVAVVAPILPPSAAARDGGAAKDAASPASSASGEAAAQPMDMIDDIVGSIIHFRLPDLPLPAILPCPPAFPIKIPFIPCRNVTPSRPPVAECRPSLAKYMTPCAAFLTGNGTGASSSPSKNCCKAIDPFFQDHSTTPLCLCHVVNGDVGKLLPAPVNLTQANAFLPQCHFELSREEVSKICGDKTTLKIPPMDVPSPPPTWRHH
ncbi:unnamed protein product [Urochloa humidicola]